MPDNEAPSTNTASAQPMGTDAPAVPASAPDLSAMSQPGASVVAGQPAPSIAGTSDYGAAIGAAQQATKNVQELSKPEPPPAPVPHERLLAMVNGLAVGLSAAGRAIATHGEQGGAKEATEVLGAQAGQKRQQQEFAMAQKNAKVQQQITVADTNYKLAQNIMLLATLPNEIAKSNLEVSGARQNQAIQGADFAAAHGGMSADEFNSAMSDSGPANGKTSGPSQFFVTNAQQQLGAASKILGEDDPYVKELTATVQNPKSTAKDLWQSTQRLQTQLSLQEKATTAAAQKATAAKDEIALGQQRVANAAWLRAVPRDKQGLPTQDFDTWQKTQQKALEQSVTQGSPDIAGKMLADGVATLSELKARGATPDFIQKTILSAQKFDPKYNASDEIVGETALKAPGTQTFFGSARSLTQSGGMLDQLKKAHDALGNREVPKFNHWADLVAYQAGDDALSNYKTALLGAADDYAKVVGGGNPTDSARDASAEQFLFDLNNHAFEKSVETARSAVRSQVEGRIGTNRYIRQREGDILGSTEAPTSTDINHPPAPDAPAAKIHKSMGDFAQHFAGKKGMIFSDDGKTWYDPHGYLVK